MIDGSAEFSLVFDLEPDTYTLSAIAGHLSGSSSFTIEEEVTGGGSSHTDNNEDELDDDTENDPIADPESPEEIEEEPIYLLENSCLDIQSEEPSIRKGSSDREAVVKLQIFLRDLGYLGPPIDGIFGNGTKAALTEFQSDNNLTSDGIFGPGTSSFVDSNCGEIEGKEEVGEEEPVADEPTEESEGDTTFIQDVVGWFEDGWNWFKNLFRRDQQDFIDESVRQNAIQVSTDEYGNTIIEVVDSVKLQQLVDEYNIKLPSDDKTVKDENGEEVSIPLPEEILTAKILDVPYLPQQMYYKDGEPVPLGTAGSVASPLKGGTSMCTGASAVMIASYYDVLPSYLSQNVTFNGEVVDEGLREFIWNDKGQNLDDSCTYQGFEVDGAFATTSLEGCALGYTSGYEDYFGKDSIDLSYRHLDPGSAKKFTTIKSSIDRNRPVMFGEPGHIMVAVGYADIPDKKQIRVNVEGGQQDVLVNTEFILLVNDPKRNRNRSKNITIDGETSRQTFSADGAKTAYLVVSQGQGKSSVEYICRSSSDHDESRYSCVEFGNTSMEVYK
ncbi:peptidoglycan-binding protein [Patescibacteria group bacterium]|nr:peptidoglycan-binding protein [Patescibacteria group bacterium]